MSFHVIPVAEADVLTLVKSIDRVILNPIIFFLFAVAMVYFLYGLAQYLLSPDNEEVRKSSKAHMVWGVVGLFIMVAVFGIMNVILNTFGIKNVNINNTGEFNVGGGVIKDNTVNDYPKTGQDLFKSTGQDISSPTSSSLPDTGSYTTSPFSQKYEPNPSVCWMKVDYVKDSSEYKALQSMKTATRAALLKETNQISKNVPDRYPMIVSSTTLYDKKGKMYYVWYDARAPVNGAKESDCKLKEIIEKLVLEPHYQSTKPNPLKGTYVSDAQYYRVVDSGTNVTYVGARSAAIYNALVQIAKLKGLNTIYGFDYTVLPEEKYYAQDPVTGKYDYWVAVEAPRYSSTATIINVPSGPVDPQGFKLKLLTAVWDPVAQVFKSDIKFRQTIDPLNAADIKFTYVFYDKDGKQMTYDEYAIGEVQNSGDISYAVKQPLGAQPFTFDFFVQRKNNSVGNWDVVYYSTNNPIQ